MTNAGASGPMPSDNAGDGPSKPAKVADTATSAASDVASTAASGAKEVASEAATQAKVVAGEAQRQLGNVIDKTRQELSAQAEDRTRRAAGGLRTLAGQVSALAEGRPGEAGPLVDYLGDARSRVTSLADRLETGGPRGLIDDVSDFARRRPVVFLAAAVGAGFMVGRLARAGRAVQQDGSSETIPPAVVYTPPSAELPRPGLLTDAPMTTDPRDTGDAGDAPLFTEEAPLTAAPYTPVPGQP
jgi:hypothetical protein